MRGRRPVRPPPHGEHGRVPDVLKTLVGSSKRAAEILADWEVEKANFLQVCPKEMLIHLPHPIMDVEEPTAVPAE